MKLYRVTQGKGPAWRAVVALSHLVARGIVPILIVPVFFSVSLLILTGCTATRWVRVNGSAQQDQDEAACRMESRRVPYVPGLWGLAFTMRQFEDCMLSKGYIKQ